MNQDEKGLNQAHPSKATTTPGAARLVIARVKLSRVIKTTTLVAVLMLACGLAIWRYLTEEQSSANYFTMAIMLAIIVAGALVVVRMIRRAAVYGVISLDADNLYLGRRAMAWAKIAQIFTVQRGQDTYLIVTSEVIPVDKLLIFEEDDFSGSSDALAYRINLADFNLEPQKIAQLLNQELDKRQATAEKKD